MKQINRYLLHVHHVQIQHVFFHLLLEINFFWLRKIIFSGKCIISGVLLKKQSSGTFCCANSHIIFSHSSSLNFAELTKQRLLFIRAILIPVECFIFSLPQNLWRQIFGKLLMPEKNTFFLFIILFLIKHKKNDTDFRQIKYF